MGQRFGGVAGLLVECLHLCLELGNFLTGGLNRFKFGRIALSAGQKFLYLQPVPFFEPVDRIQPALDFIQLAGVKFIGVQPVGQIGGKLSSCIVQLTEPFRQRGKAFVKPGAALQPIARAAKQVGRAGDLPLFIAGQREVGGG